MQQQYQDGFNLSQASYPQILQQSQIVQQKHEQVQQGRPFQCYLYKQFESYFRNTQFIPLAVNYYWICQYFIDRQWSTAKVMHKMAKNIFPLIVQAKTKQIQFQNIDTKFEEGNVDIIKSLSKIMFLDLQVLNLSSNHIVSIEHLAKLNAPTLVKLSLRQNFITESNPLTKCYFPQLEILQLDRNLIRSFQFLTRMNVKCLKVFLGFRQYCYLKLEEWWFNYVDGNIIPQMLYVPCNDLTFLFKMNAKERVYIIYEGAGIITNFRLWPQLQVKYYNELSSVSRFSTQFNRFN